MEQHVKVLNKENKVSSEFGTKDDQLNRGDEVTKGRKNDEWRAELKG